MNTLEIVLTDLSFSMKIKLLTFWSWLLEDQWKNKKAQRVQAKSILQELHFWFKELLEDGGEEEKKLPV